MQFNAMPCHAMLLYAMPQSTQSTYLSMNIHEHYLWTSSAKCVLLIISIAMQCNAIQCNAMQCNAMKCNAMQCNAMQCNAMQCNAMQCNLKKMEKLKFLRLVLKLMTNMFMIKIWRKTIISTVLKINNYENGTCINRLIKSEFFVPFNETIKLANRCFLCIEIVH